MYKAHFNPNPSTGLTLEEVDDTSLPSSWVRASISALVPPGGACMVLIGAADLLGFRLREAQSLVRADAMPGFFSHAALALTGMQPEQLEVWHVPIAAAAADCATVPARNGIATLRLEELDEAGLYPNLAVLYAPLEDTVALRSAARNLQGARLMDDLVTPIPAWLAYAWQCANSANPLHSGLGIPSAMFVEACYGAARFDIIPGTTQRIVSPEAIWQAAKWWHASVGQEPMKGRYRLQQREAAVTFNASPQVAQLPRDA